jgi:hypothetical protein
MRGNVPAMIRISTVAAVRTAQVSSDSRRRGVAEAGEELGIRCSWVSRRHIEYSFTYKAITAGKKKNCFEMDPKGGTAISLSNELGKGPYRRLGRAYW